MSFQVLRVIISYPIRGIKIKYIYIFQNIYFIIIPRDGYEIIAQSS